MKIERRGSCLLAMCLGFALAFGAAGAMVTGLNLNVTNMGRIALVCLGGVCFTGILSRIPYGGWLVSAMILGSALALGWYTPWETQAVDMLHKISRYYHNAYGWQVVASPLRGTGPMDHPVGLLAFWIACANCWNLARGQKNGTGILAALVPLAASVVVVDTVPDSGYLYLWLLGLVLVLLSAVVRREDPRRGDALTVIAAVPAALALGLLFWAVPREGYDKQPEKLQQSIVDWFQQLPDLWNEVRDEVAANLDGAVQPQSVRLDTLGPRLKRVYPVMEVTAPVSGTVYLRGQHYDGYTGAGWTVTQGSRDRFETPPGTRELGEITVSTRRARDVVYLPYYPDADQTLLDGSLDNAEEQKLYSWTMRGLPSHWRNLVRSAVAAGGTPLFQAQQAENSRAVNRYLPEETYLWAVKLVDSLLTEEASATDVADTIGKYVRASARYDLGTARMDGEYDDFARWFLEAGETGYCVHFATAATVLLRAAGVEARYVEGYMFTARMGEETTVTADQAHAWAEYYEPVLDAWIVLEATPPDLGEDAPPQTQPEQTFPPTESPTETTQPGQRPPEGTQPGQQATQSAEGNGIPQKTDLSGLRKGLGRLLLTALVLVLPALQRRLRLYLRDARLARGSLRRRGLALYRETERLSKLLGTVPAEQARSLAEKAKYSRQGIDEAELAVLTGFYRDTLDQMTKRPWYRKIADKYLFAAW